MKLNLFICSLYWIAYIFKTKIKIIDHSLLCSLT